MARGLSDYLRDFLSARQDWKLISGFFEPEVKPLSDPAHLAWLSRNEDRHPHRELLLIVEGKCHCSLNRQIYPCGPGVVLVFDKGDCHDLCYPPMTTGAIHLWIGLVHEVIIGRVVRVDAGKISPVGQSAFTLENRELATVVNYVMDISRQSSESDTVKRAELVSALTLVLGLLLERVEGKGEPLNGFTRQAKVIHAIQKHIEQTAGNGLNLDNLSKVAGYSKFHFCRLFRKHVGQTPLRYIDESRVKRVVALREKGYIDKEISGILGFSCQASFCRWYRKQKENGLL